MAGRAAAALTRALAWAGLAVGGVLLGATGAVVQAMRSSVAGRSVPWGLLLCLVTLGVAVRGAVWVRRRRAGGAVVAVGWVAATLVLSQAGPGGDVLLPEGLRSLVYLVGGLLVAALATAWPLPAGTGRPRATPDPIGASAPAVDRR